LTKLKSERIAEIVKRLKKYNLPIGVSVYPTADSNKILKDAGADEIKYNVETMDRDLFEKMCLGLSLDFVISALKDAVRVLGKNRVFSNIIIGLGESDETVISGVEELAKIGVIPMLRAAVEHPLRSHVAIKRPAAERLLRLAEKEREILDRYGLRCDRAQTMCAPCAGCDLIPHRDL
jgi:biotin synthase-related radical SAM superfamily protein